MPYDFKFGSETAKGGFKHEKLVAAKFRNWQSDKDAQKWLEIMNYDLNQIRHLYAVDIPPRISIKKAKKFGLKNVEELKYKKTDVQVQLRIQLDNAIKVENISIKKANDDAGYNQVDKRYVDDYQKMWCFNNTIATSLKLFTGEYNPNTYNDVSLFIKLPLNKLKDKRRVYLNEFNDKIIDDIVNFFKCKKFLVVSDTIKGRGFLAAEWLMVVKYFKSKNRIEWVLKNINEALNIFSQGSVHLTRQGNLMIGKIIMQRKGGTPDPTKLQFKINPLIMF